MSREAKVQAVVEAAVLWESEWSSITTDNCGGQAVKCLRDAVRALHQPEPKWRAQGLGDVYGPDKSNVVCYRNEDYDSNLRDRVLRLLLADEAKEGAQ